MDLFILSRFYHVKRGRFRLPTNSKYSRSQCQPTKGVKQSMLKNLGYNGTCHEHNISVSLFLDNPLDYGFESLTLVFIVTENDKESGAANLRFSTFRCRNNFDRIVKRHFLRKYTSNNSYSQDYVFWAIKY